ncbi:MAG: hypothetical protein ACK481_07825 [Candidatus Melainabacteria bacterium]|jgi:hypothetical protein
MSKILISARTPSFSSISEQGVLTSRNPLEGIVKPQPSDGSVISRQKSLDTVEVGSDETGWKTFSREVYLKTLNTVIRYELTSDQQIRSAQVLPGIENNTETLVINSVSSKPEVIQAHEAEIMNPNGSLFTDQEKEGKLSSLHESLKDYNPQSKPISADILENTIDSKPLEYITFDPPIKALEDNSFEIQPNTTVSVYTEDPNPPSVTGAAAKLFDRGRASKKIQPKQTHILNAQ